MTYRKVPLVSGEYFHVYNRGNSKQPIFLDDDDRDRFIKLLYLQNTSKNIKFREDIIRNKINALDFDKGDNIISIGAWVLMPNHFHLYLTLPRSGLGKIEDAYAMGISYFLRKVCTSYAMYFNKKYDRTGSLFEGRFKAVHIEDDIQAKYLFSYIHLNPIKLIDPKWKEEGIKDKKTTLEFLEKYKWSSYLDYKGIKRKESKILDRDSFINYFSDIESFNKEIFDWINFHK